MNTSTSERFEELCGLWEQHCEASRVSSNPFVYVASEAFEAIVGLGEEAIPLIIERYRDGSLFWGAALCRITGKGDFGDGLTGNLEATRDRWLAWWEDEGSG